MREFLIILIQMRQLPVIMCTVVQVNRQKDTQKIIMAYNVAYIQNLNKEIVSAITNYSCQIYQIDFKIQYAFNNLDYFGSHTTNFIYTTKTHQQFSFSTLGKIAIYYKLKQFCTQKPIYNNKSTSTLSYWQKFKKCCPYKYTDKIQTLFIVRRAPLSKQQKLQYTPQQQLQTRTLLHLHNDTTLL
eukprot:TRINITY_DN5867_c0_g1_i7.p2 TRINITY_DN5867_c0_g1~~TRINITY_DN5867_c0_g1_i7.p2  ORF type:complete len:185 (+),score=-8.79 TRINITY_DN5867_c0_g1_i7:448-1002(+)